MHKTIEHIDDAAFGAATDFIRSQKLKTRRYLVVAIGTAVVLMTCIVCASIVACNAITAQQDTIKQLMVAVGAGG